MISASFYEQVETHIKNNPAVEEYKESDPISGYDIKIISAIGKSPEEVADEIIIDAIVKAINNQTSVLR